MKKNKRYIVVTDLDGTLLDHHTYSHEEAQPALQYLLNRHYPIIINTSKTAEEVAHLQSNLKIDEPFIIENGSAVYLPQSKIAKQPEGCDSVQVINKQYWLKSFGARREHIVKILNELREKHGWQFEGFSDWTPAHIAEITGLSQEEASLAATREFSEPLLWSGPETELKNFELSLADNQLHCLRGGRFLHILGQTNKGKAINWLREFYQTVHQAPVGIIALGDGPNDIDMLDLADIPVLVRSPVHAFPDIPPSPTLIKTENTGPKGWNEAIQQLIPNFLQEHFCG